MLTEVMTAFCPRIVVKFDMEHENFINVANYTLASSELPKYIEKMFCKSKLGLTERADDMYSAWYYLKDIISNRFDFTRLVQKDNGKREKFYEIVSIDIGLELLDSVSKKPIKTWMVNINSDHNLHYQKTPGKEARQQRPHYGFTIQRNNNPSALGVNSSKNKQKIVAHLYLPQKAKNPDHYRMKNDQESAAEKVVACCRQALQPIKVDFLPSKVVHLKDKRGRLTRTMKITASCETHNRTVKGPIMQWPENRSEVVDVGGRWFSWGCYGLGCVTGAVGVVIAALTFEDS